MPLSEAVELAIKECIENDILADYLRKNRAEVTHVSIYEYDEEKHMRQEQEASREEGFLLGREQGQQLTLISQISKKLKKDKTPAIIANELELDLATVQAICDVASKYAPDYDCDSILQEMQENK